METRTRSRVVCVDDEHQVLSGLSLHLRRRYQVETATSGAAALELLAREPQAAVVISDMRMPGIGSTSACNAQRLRARSAARVRATPSTFG